MEIQGLSAFLWLGLAVFGLALVSAPLIIWRNTAETNRLLTYLIEETEQSNELLADIRDRLDQKDHAKEQPRCAAPNQADDNDNFKLS